MEMKLKTNLNCASCVSKVKPFLDQESTISSWSVDTATPDKILTVRGDQLSQTKIEQTVALSGFKVLSSQKIDLETYKPLLLIFLYLVAVVFIVESMAESINVHRAMRHFMGGFFLVFSFFKFLNLETFADAYRTYDVVAKRFRPYGMFYPFIELSLGVLYLLNVVPQVINLITLIVMGISSVGVLIAVQKKQAIQCACLGTVFNLPMTKVTLFEDLLMVGMALFMLLF